MNRNRSARHWLSGGVASLFLLIAADAFALQSVDAAELLRKADSVKTSNYTEFVSLVRQLQQSSDLSASQRQYLRYLQGWQNAYIGDYPSAIPVLKQIADDTAADTTLRFRAAAAVANVLVLAAHYDDAFVQLGHVVALLPEVTDTDAREQGLAVAAYLYNQVGEYDLALNYAEKLAEGAMLDRRACVAQQVRVWALYKSGRLKSPDTEFQKGIDTCVGAGELTHANVIRTFLARWMIDQSRFDDAIELLREHHDEVIRARYPRVISEFNALLAQAYRQTGDSALVRQYAHVAIETAVKDQYTEPLVAAYRLLYLLAKEQADPRAALSFHEKYAAADKGYLDDVSARQLAYERVKHETMQSKLQIDALNNDNRVLQLQQELGSKAAETSRLYIALLLLVLAFIGAWAYRTKRSQLHFMKLSQIDGLTGINNRPRFIDLAEGTLDNSRRTQQEVSVVLCDLDHFKSINDRHGHATGDYVLKQAVAACQAHLRSSDIFGRFGGEEFCVLLPGCGLEAARQRAEQLRLAIAAITIQHKDVQSNISASFGIAATGLSGFELRQLLAHADSALYEAKNAGRNCVVLYDAKGVVSPLASPPQDERLRGVGR